MLLDTFSFVFSYLFPRTGIFYFIGSKTKYTYIVVMVSSLWLPIINFFRFCPILNFLLFIVVYPYMYYNYFNCLFIYTHCDSYILITFWLFPFLFFSVMARSRILIDISYNISCCGLTLFLSLQIFFKSITERSCFDIFAEVFTWDDVQILLP